MKPNPMMNVETAIYARFSSENQREASIEDQDRSCRRLCAEKGWQAVGTYSDSALSGATTLRPGYQRLMSDARAGKFRILVAEGLDRLSRDQATTASLFKVLSYLGVMIYTIAEGEVNELHIGLKGTMNALALKDLALKTHRGVEGRVRKGRFGGGRAYGYRTIDNGGERGLREIVEAEAKIVRRIFAAFAAGKSPRAIARDLNSERIPGPNGKMWWDTTIRGYATRRTGILRNTTYVGRPEWNKQTYLRNPDTGKRVARVRPDAERIVIEAPSLRLVDQSDWDAVQARLDAIRVSPGSQKQRSSEFWRHRRPTHLLTGLVCCGLCGGRMGAVGKDYLACTAARSGAGCSNRKSIRRKRVEEAVLEGLKVRLMAPEAVREFISEFNNELNRQHSQEELDKIEHVFELARVSKKIKGLYDAIADGLRTPGLKVELERLENRQAELQNLIESMPASQPRFHPKLAEVYRAMVSDLHAALDDPGARQEAAEILRGLVAEITVAPDGDGFLIGLTGEIVKLVTLPGGTVPKQYMGSVKVVAGARNRHYLLFRAVGLLPAN